MSNVFDIKSGKRRSPSNDAGSIGRAEALRKSLARKVFFSKEDQRKAAQNLYRLLVELESIPGCGKVNIAREAGLGGNCGTDSTKRLREYTLPDNASEKRLAALAKKPGKYFDFAEAIGRISKRSEVSYLCQIFDGCSFGTGSEFQTDQEEENWIRLAHQLSRMAEAVIATVDLASYWRDVKLQSGKYDPRNDDFSVELETLWPVAPGEGLAEFATEIEIMPPVPSVVLARRRQGGGFPCRLKLQDGQKIVLEVSSWLEIRLALAPGPSEKHISGLVEYRTVLDGVDEVGREINIINDGLASGGFRPYVQLNGHGLQVSEWHVQVELPEEAYFWGPYHGALEWKAISSALLRELFDAPNSHFEMSSRLTDEHRKEVPITLFPAHSVADIVQAELESGALEQDLIWACHKIKDKFYQYRRDARELVRRAEAKAEARWTNMISQSETEE